MHTANWPIIKQLHKKILKHGAKDLSDVELLAIFIKSETKEKTDLESAYSLLNNFGGIRNIFDANKEKLCNHPDINEEKYIQLQAILEIARRYLEEQLINTKIITIINNTDSPSIFPIEAIK